jgi:hypothetical protein
VANSKKAPRGGKRSGKTEFALGVCAAVKDGMPDMYNAVPKRAVTQDEARSHGWPHFFDMVTKCPQGHVAARYMSNTFRCVDCARIADGKLPIYGTRSNEDLIGEAITAPEYQNPDVRTDFKWTDEYFRQFCVAYVNTGDVTAALKLVNARPFDLITELRNNPERAALFEATRTDVDQVFLWKAEGNAATGSDRAMLARAGATFPDRFGSRAQAGVGAEAYVNPDKAVAELAKLLSSARESLAQRSALGAARGAGSQLESTDTSAATAAGVDVEEVVLLGPPLDNSDLI